MIDHENSLRSGATCEVRRAEFPDTDATSVAQGFHDFERVWMGLALKSEHVSRSHETSHVALRTAHASEASPIRA